MYNRRKLPLCGSGLLTIHRRWANGEVKSSYWLGDGKARVCSKVKGLGDRNAKTDGSTYWPGQVVNKCRDIRK